MKKNVRNATKRICENVQKNHLTIQEAYVLFLLNYLDLLDENPKEHSQVINRSNEYIAGWMNCTPRTVSSIISKLVKKKIIHSAKEGKSRQLQIEDERYLWLK